MYILGKSFTYVDEPYKISYQMRIVGIRDVMMNPNEMVFCITRQSLEKINDRMEINFIISKQELESIRYNKDLLYVWKFCYERESGNDCVECVLDDKGQISSIRTITKLDYFLNRIPSRMEDPEYPLKSRVTFVSHDLLYDENQVRRPRNELMEIHEIEQICKWLMDEWKDYYKKENHPET